MENNQSKTVSQAVAARIKELLEEKKISKPELKRKSCLPYETIKSIMFNKAKGVNLKTIISLADGFGITAAEFLNSPLFNYENLEM